MRRILLLLVAAVRLGAQLPQATLVERLGLPAGSKALIINADDAGLLHAENLATIEAMKTGLVGSATVMTPSPWFPELVALAQENPQFDFGVHLTFTAEWQGFRYGPVLGPGAVPSLVDKQ